MVTHTVQRYAGVGYTDRFETAPGGLRSESTGKLHPPQALEAEHVLALGVPTPEAGETLLFALHSRLDDSRGTWVVARDANLPREAARLFGGLMDNTELPIRIARALGVDFRPGLL